MASRVAIRDDALLEQGTLLVGAVAVVERDLVQTRRACRLLQGERAGNDETDDDRGHQVEHDGGGCRDDEDDGVAPGGAHQRSEAGHLDHLHGRRQKHPG